MMIGPGYKSGAPILIVGRGRQAEKIRTNLEAMGAERGGRGLEVRGRDSWRDLPAASAAIVACSSSSHAAVAGVLLENGVPTLIEKPIATTMMDAEYLLRVARGGGQRLDGHRRLAAVHTYLWSPAFHAFAARLIDHGFVHCYTSGGANGPQREDCDALLDWAPHDVAMALSLVRDRTLSAEVDCTHLTPQFKDGSGNYLLAMKFKSGELCECMVGNRFPYRIRGGYARLGNGEIAEFQDETAPTSDSESPMRLMLKSFLNFADGAPRDDRLSPELAVEVLRVIDLARNRIAANGGDYRGLPGR